MTLNTFIPRLPVAPTELQLQHPRHKLRLGPPSKRVETF